MRNPFEIISFSLVFVLKKYFTRSLRSLVKYFSTLEEKFLISARPCNTLDVQVSISVARFISKEQQFELDFAVDCYNRRSFYYKEQSTAKSNSFKIAQKTAFEVKRRLYTTGKVIQRLFIIDLYT